MQGASNQIPGPNGELALWNGDASRLHVRKAQYHYGWDWGPVLMCVGPWKPIRLEAYTVRISELRTEVNIQSESSALVVLKVDIAGAIVQELGATLTLTDPTGEKYQTSLTVPAGSHSAEGSITVANPKLWYPVGKGHQPLYVASVTLVANGVALHTTEKRIGLRKARIVQKSLDGEKEGGSFYFEVNGLSIFAGGSFLSFSTHTEAFSDALQGQIGYLLTIFLLRKHLGRVAERLLISPKGLARSLPSLAPTPCRWKSKHGSSLGWRHL